MGLCLLVIIAIGSLLFWLYQMNKDYYVLSFFAPRVKTKDSRSVESIAPMPKGRTIFGNCFDMYGKSHSKFQLNNYTFRCTTFNFLTAEFFEHSRDRAREMNASYLEYGLGLPIYNIIDAENAELILNDPSMITKGFIYDFLQPALRTGLLTSTGELH